MSYLHNYVESPYFLGWLLARQIAFQEKDTPLFVLLFGKNTRWFASMNVENIMCVFF